VLEKLTAAGEAIAIVAERTLISIESFIMSRCSGVLNLKIKVEHC
jgi:hypothetical protein